MTDIPVLIRGDWGIRAELNKPELYTRPGAESIDGSISAMYDVIPGQVCNAKYFSRMLSFCHSNGADCCEPIGASVDRLPTPCMYCIFWYVQLCVEHVTTNAYHSSHLHCVVK